ncbi:MAG: hypothetical protein SF162_09445 [bacterium]|nr:hypothetical protein [bacterium]
MMPTYYDPDIRAAKLVDLPVLRRLTEHASILDSEMYCTRDTVGVHGALISGGLWSRDHYTIVGKAHKQMIAGQIRIHPADHLAQIVFVAPSVEEGDDNTPLLNLVDALALVAGRRGAHMLTAEVDELSPLFTTLRTANFAVYARQELWRAGLPLAGETTRFQPVTLTRETGDDAFDIQLLYSSIVPRLVQPVVVPPPDCEGWVYRENGQVRGYITVSEGKNGIYVVPFLHPDIGTEQVAAVLAGALNALPRPEKRPITVCVRRYQDWLDTALTMLGFEMCGQQAVMVRHIAAGVRHAAYPSLAQVLDTLPAAARTPTQRLIKTIRPLQPGEAVTPQWNVG